MILTAVVPTHNEAGSIAGLIDALLSLRSDTIDIRVLVVDDASSDGTGRLVEERSRLHPGTVELMQRNAKRGLGSAYVEGFARALASGADLVAQLDADFSHDPRTLLTMIGAIERADLVLGSRYVAGGGVDKEWGPHRKLISGLANRVVVPAILSLPVSDATSGYRLWRRETLARVAPAASIRSNGYGFQVETVYLAHRLGCRIVEVPIHFRERTSGRSKMTPLVALSAIREIFALRWRGDSDYPRPPAENQR